MARKTPGISPVYKAGDGFVVLWWDGAGKWPRTKEFTPGAYGSRRAAQDKASAFRERLLAAWPDVKGTWDEVVHGRARSARRAPRPDGWRFGLIRTKSGFRVDALVSGVSRTSHTFSVVRHGSMDGAEKAAREFLEACHAAEDPSVVFRKPPRVSAGSDGMLKINVDGAVVSYSIRKYGRDKAEAMLRLSLEKGKRVTLEEYEEHERDRRESAGGGSSPGDE